MNDKILLFAQSAGQPQNLMINGVSVRLNFSDKQNPDAFENIRKTLLQTHQVGKKIAQIQ